MERLTDIARRLEAHAHQVADQGLQQSAELDSIIMRTRRLIEESRVLIQQANDLLAANDDGP